MQKKQAKCLSVAQERAVLNYLAQTRSPARNKAIFLLSMRAGLRAKEIAGLTWDMVTGSDNVISDVIQLRDSVTKGNSGGVIPLAKDLRNSLCELRSLYEPVFSDAPIVQTQRKERTSAQVIVNLFAHWYGELGFDGCSSHSGRRTFITRAARNIGKFGGSLRDVQELARHRSIAMTQRYIEIDREALRKVVDFMSN